MMLVLTVIWGAVTVGIEAWRRTFRRSLRWVHAFVIASQFVGIACMAGAWWRIRDAFAAIAYVNPADRQIVLAQGVASAFALAALACGCALVSAIVLAWNRWSAGATAHRHIRG